MNLRKLETIKEKLLNEIKFREEQNPKGKLPYKYEVMVCGTTACISSGANNIKKYFEDEIKARGLESSVRVNTCGCLGLCALGPIAIVYPNGVFYSKLNLEKVKNIVSKHFIDGNVVEEYLIEDNSGKKTPYLKNIQFYKKQKFIATNSAGIINPEKINDYIAINGYSALYNVLNTLKPSEVVGIIKESGLRGRGGAGFPTGTKWEFTAKNISKQKYVICNADEGDPGAFMDRTIIESNPHTIIEAMAIAGYAIGASVGYVYLRAEYPRAGEILENAIKQAYKQKLLGANIFGKNFSFDLSIKYGAGAFVCGEETALLNSIEGKRGEPHTKPPYPAEHGLFGYPTVINNVETFANITKIILNGAEWFKSIGLPDCSGTKVFALSGKINTTGIIELPMGTTIKEIIYDIGGGCPNGKEFKAVQMGGPSGGCIPKKYINTPIDYKSLIALGSMMGSGGMIVLDEDTCMVNLAKFFLEFIVDESCGKCTPCRIGNKRMLEILTRICDGNGKISDLDELESLAIYIKENSLCGLGQSSPNPVLSTLKYFKNEYLEHIKNHHCPAGVCKNLMAYEITEKCVGCFACARSCPVNAISGELKKQFKIDENKCIKCGKCYQTCKFGAIKIKGK